MCSVYIYIWIYITNYIFVFRAPSNFYRAMLCIRGTSYGPVSVCLSQVDVLLKRLNLGRHKQHHTIAQDCSFLMPKISAKFDRSHHLRGRQMQVGWVIIDYFRQITGYISKTVKDRHIVSIKVEWEAVCAPSNGGISHDFNFGTLTYHSTFHPAEEKSSLKGAWSGSK